MRPNSSTVGVNASSRVGKLGPMNCAESLKVISLKAMMPSLFASEYVYVRPQRPYSGYPGSLRCVLRLPVKSGGTPSPSLVILFLFVDPVRVKSAAKLSRSKRRWLSTTS